MYMSHAASHQHPESRATERCPSIACARNQHGGNSPGVVARFRTLATPSISISPRSSGDRAQRGIGRACRPNHAQGLGRRCTGASGLCRGQWFDHGRDCGAIGHRLSGRSVQAWLIERLNASGGTSVSTIPLTGCLPVKFNKPTVYLPPTQHGLQANIPQRERKTVTVAAIYTRVSSDKQREKNTIASQTTALIDFARSRGHHVPDEWIFEDDGYSGATLIRPGLERVRDLAAEGQIHAVLVHAPDRLSRKYAYQVLLIEEFARHGVETIFLKAPQTTTAEDQLLVQFQGMIAEYERAQILERSRRGKRHRAHQGQVSVLSGAPYGYRYVRRSDDAAAYYEVIEAEADVVRMVYNNYVSQGLSIGAITRLLNEQGVPTRKQTSRWERSTAWAMLRNPAYKDRMLRQDPVPIPPTDHTPVAPARRCQLAR